MADNDQIEYKKFATNVMIEATKLLITLASGFIVLSISFLTFIGKGTGPMPLPFFGLLIFSWAAAIFSIAFGILSLGGIATSANDKFSYDVDDPTTRCFLRLQQITFVIGFIFFCVFAAINH